MAAPTIDELKTLAREVFGREISDAQAEAYRGRLPAMARNVRTLQARERALGPIDPALVQHAEPGKHHG